MPDFEQNKLHFTALHRQKYPQFWGFRPENEDLGLNLPSNWAICPIWGENLMYVGRQIEFQFVDDASWNHRFLMDLTKIRPKRPNFISKIGFRGEKLEFKPQIMLSEHNFRPSRPKIMGLIHKMS